MKIRFRFAGYGSAAVACRRDESAARARYSARLSVAFFCLTFLGLGFCWGTTEGADRTRHYFPLSPDAVPVDSASIAALPGADQATCQDGSELSVSWANYRRLWEEHAGDPSLPAIRRFLGIPGDKPLSVRVSGGRSAPAYLKWRPGSYRQIETPHFRIFSRSGSGDVGIAIARDLERCYWIWTQAFFPLWEGHAQVRVGLRAWRRAGSVEAHLRGSRSRLRSGDRMTVVVLRDATDYRVTLGKQVPGAGRMSGIGRSTGFYSEDLRTSFFYPPPSGVDTAESAGTRRHELFHQLFREATRTRLGRRSPGAEAGFWLVEGIAGYAESMRVGARHATLGGWDAPRLQFARYRVLVNQDTLPLSRLAAAGRIEAQRQADLPRWYAHAIAHTHRLVDGGDVGDRRRVYARLAELYAIETELETPAGSFDSSPGALASFLRVDDAVLAAGPPHRGLTKLCLAGCDVTPGGLRGLGGFDRLDWLDVSRLAVGNRDVAALVRRPDEIAEVNLEATRIDSGIADFLGQCHSLVALDLSWTRIDDRVIAGLSAAGLRTLWLTGTRVSDASIGPLIGMSELTEVDVQRTGVTERGLARLRAARPDVQINPLELRAPE